MLSKEELETYSRHLLLDEVGIEGQLKLKQAKVLVIGAGGLGCPVLQYVNAAGVGTIGIADFDIVDKSNLQRQILFGWSSLGKKKAEAAKERLNDNNPLTDIQTYSKGINPENALEIIGNYDIVVDCTDNYGTRYLINDACVFLGKPLVYAAIYKFEGQVSVFNYDNGPSYRCLYPEMPKSASITNCSESGVLGVLPGVIGTMQANEVLKLILDLGNPLSGSLLMYNGLTGKSSAFGLQKSKHAIYDRIRNEERLDAKDYQISCLDPKSDVLEIDVQQFISMLEEDVQLIDVREQDELPVLDQLNALNIPLDQIAERVGEIDKTRKTIVFCKSGVRSRRAIETLQDNLGFQGLINLKGGVLSYTETLHSTQLIN